MGSPLALWAIPPLTSRYTLSGFKPMRINPSSKKRSTKKGMKRTRQAYRIGLPRRTTLRSTCVSLGSFHSTHATHRSFCSHPPTPTQNFSPQPEKSKQPPAILASFLNNPTTEEASKIVDALDITANEQTFSICKQIEEELNRRNIPITWQLRRALIEFYTKTRKLGEAIRLLDGLVDHHLPDEKTRQVIMRSVWNPLISSVSKTNERASEAFKLYQKLREQGFTPDSYTISSILTVCKSLDMVRQLESEAGDRTKKDAVLAASFIHTYHRCGSLRDARRIFDSSATADLKNQVFSWNMMMHAYNLHHQPREVKRLYEAMTKGSGPPPNLKSLNNALTACAELHNSEGLAWGKEIHNLALTKFGTKSRNNTNNTTNNTTNTTTNTTNKQLLGDRVVVLSLINMYAKCGSQGDARRVLEDSTPQVRNEPDFISDVMRLYNASSPPRHQETLDLFFDSIQRGIKPNYYSQSNALAACGGLGSAAALEKGRQIHTYLVDNKILRSPQNRETYLLKDELVAMYSSCDAFDDAYAVFESMEQRNTIMYTHIIKALGARKEGSKALQLFNQMKSEGQVPDAKCYQVILVACSHSGLVDEGLKLFKQMKDQGITPDVYHYNALVDLFARVGRLDEAEKVIEEMPVKPTRVTWAIVLNGCKVTNDVERAERIAEKLFEMDPKKHSTYTLLASIYTACGRVEDAARITKLAKERGATQQEPDTRIRPTAPPQAK